MFQKNNGRKLSFATSFASAAVAGLIAIAGSSARAQEKIAGEYLVKYKTNSFSTMFSLKSTPALQVMDHNTAGQIMKIKVNPAQEAFALAQVLRNPNVEYVVPNIRLRAFLHSQSEVGALVKLQDQYANKVTRVEEAWAIAGNKGSKNVLVAVIDTGVDYGHESLKTQMVSGYDFVQNDSDPMDITGKANPGHGTHCAGSVGGNGVVEGGIQGASAEVSIMPLRFLNEEGGGDLNNGIKAIDLAIKNGAKVISASWGATVPQAQAQPLIDAVQRASDAGVIMVMAAANDGRNNDTTDVFPTNAQTDNSISVSASGPNDEKPSWSNYGRANVHIAAPGLDILSTIPGNKYMRLSGTSMATPLVAGIVAFLKAQDPSLSGREIRALMQLTGAKAQIEVACNCRVDMLAATETILAKKLFISPAAATMKSGDTKQFFGTYAKGSVSFEVADTNIGEIDSTGKFTAKAEGETSVTVTDSSGATSTSLAIRVGNSTGGGGPGNPPGGGGGGNCPLGDQMMCDIICGIAPELPFCQ